MSAFTHLMATLAELKEARAEVHAAADHAEELQAQCRRLLDAHLDAEGEIAEMNSACEKMVEVADARYRPLKARLEPLMRAVLTEWRQTFRRAPGGTVRAALTRIADEAGQLSNAGTDCQEFLDLWGPVGEFLYQMEPSTN